MFMRRRRPLLRGAMVGGAAYYAGKRAQEGQQQDEMTEARFNWRLARQMPQEEKKAKADFVIDTTQSLETVRKQVNEIIAACLAGGGP